MADHRISSLLVSSASSEIESIHISPKDASWDLLHFAARTMAQADRWEHDTGDHEMAIVWLGGSSKLRSSHDDFGNVGEREHVFDGMPFTVYFPPNTQFEIEATSPQLDLAYGWCSAEEAYPARLIRPEEVSVEIRGGGNATRQINNMIPPGFACQRLVVVEVYTPSGNWSSYPPHKHDVHKENEQGEILEADLEEIYYYRLDPPDGFAYQRVYTADGSLDELIMARDRDMVLVPEGYHPVVSAHGYTTYYLNMLAGSAQSLANSDDPDHAWVKDHWREKDPRLPLVSLKTGPGS